MVDKCCNQCGKTLPIECFYKRSDGGITARCKACVIEKAAARRASDQYKQWLDCSRERRRERKTEYRRKAGIVPRPPSKKKQKQAAILASNMQHVIEYRLHMASEKAKAKKKATGSRWQKLTAEEKKEETKRQKDARNKARLNADLSYCRRLLTKNSRLKASDLPLGLVLAKQAQLKIVNLIREGA